MSRGRGGFWRRLAAAGSGCALLLAVLLAAGCERELEPPPPEPTTYKQSRMVFGTFAEVTAVAPNQTVAAAAVEAAYASFERFATLLSNWDPNSEIERVNALTPGGSLPVAPETLHCLERGLALQDVSGGAFDMRVGPLLDLWQAAEAADTSPTPAELTATVARVQAGELRLDPDRKTVTVVNAAVDLALGGIAKGYALDLAADAMLAAGADAALIDIGGDVLAVGTQLSGAPWRIGLKDPFARGNLRVLTLTNRAVATSGEQQRFYTIGGQRYSHIIDPRTGRPAAQAPSVTVVAGDGLTADAWATALSVLSVAEGRALLETMPDVEALWITSSTPPEVVSTSGFTRFLGGPAVRPSAK